MAVDSTAEGDGYTLIWISPMFISANDFPKLLFFVGEEQLNLKSQFFAHPVVQCLFFNLPGS